jgi:pyridinium-3,5-biscarboxylic acid mononucleotide sulfurtransferase
MDAQEKYNRLKEEVGGLKRVVVAFSGGVDSTFLLKVSVDVLGREDVLAFIGSSPTFPVSEIEEAKRLAEEIGVDYLVVETSEMADQNFLQNTRQRCYYCKSNLFDLARRVAEKKGFAHVLEGSNLDDMDDFRPGRKACIEKGVLSPLLEAELTKQDIRALSLMLGLPTHDKPSYACLSSRIPYGTPIDREILGKIEQSEAFIRGVGVRQVRVRYHGSVARIEVAETDIGTIIAHGQAIADALAQCGFTYVTLDLKGYRTGSMNEQRESNEE